MRPAYVGEHPPCNLIQDWSEELKAKAGRTYGKKMTVESGQWSTLRVVAVGRLFEVYFNSQVLYEVEDATFPDAGTVGVWTKADSVTYFDDLSVAVK